jgi:hypothetical protein
MVDQGDWQSGVGFSLKLDQESNHEKSTRNFKMENI